MDYDYIDLPALACSAAIEVDRLLVGKETDFAACGRISHMLQNVLKLNTVDLISIRKGLLEMSKEASRQKPVPSCGCIGH